MPEKSSSDIRSETDAPSNAPVEPEGFWSGVWRRNRGTAAAIFAVSYLLGLLVYVLVGSAADSFTIVLRGSFDRERPVPEMSFVLVGPGEAEEHGRARLDADCHLSRRFASGLFFERPSDLNDTSNLSTLDDLSALDDQTPAEFPEVSILVVTSRYSVPVLLKETDFAPSPDSPKTLRADLGRFLPATEPLGGLLRPFFRGPVLNWPGAPTVFLRSLVWWPVLCLFPLSLIVSEEIRRRDERSNRRRKFAVLLIATLGPTGVAMIGTYAFLLRFFEVDSAQLIAATREIYLYARMLRPNPALMKSYVATLAAFPVYLVLFYGLASLWLRRIESGTGRRLNRAFLLCYFAGVVVPVAALDGLFPPLASILSLNLLRLPFILVTAVALLGMYYESTALRRFAIYSVSILSVLFIVVVFLIRLHNNFFPPEPHHYNSVYYSVCQTMVGKTPLVDVNSLYGCYALLLEPVLRVIGYGTLSFTFLMSLLTCTSLVCLALALRLLIRDRLILALGTFYLLFFVYVFQYVWNSAIAFTMMYHQQVYLMRFPIRSITVYAGLFLMLLYFKRRPRVLYFTIFPFVFLSLFWNLDTGVILPIIWIASLLVDEALRSGRGFLKRRPFYAASARHAGWFLGFGVVVPLLVSVYVFVRSGVWPDYAELLHFIQSHAMAGFFSVPMRLNDFACLTWLIYAAGCFYTLRCLVRGKDRYLARCSLILALFGFGLFPYYLNRSQPMNLFMTTFPAVMLGLVLLDRLHPAFRRSRRIERVEFGGFGYALLFVVLLNGFAMSLEYSANQLTALRVNLRLLCERHDDYTPVPVEIRETFSVAQNRRNIAFLRNRTTPGESILILNDNYDAYYYGESQTRSVLDLPSSTEWSRWDEIGTLKEFLLQNEDVKVFADPLNLPPKTLNRSVALEILNLLSEHYDVVEMSPLEGTLVLLKKKTPPSQPPTQTPGADAGMKKRSRAELRRRGGAKLFALADKN